MSSRASLATVAAMGLAALALPATGSAASATCSYSPATATLTVTVPETSIPSPARIGRTTGGVITVDGAPCSSVTDTDTIVIVGDAGAFHTVVLSLANGPAGPPGKTLEASGRSEIEVRMDLATGNYDSFTLGGSRGIDRFTFGTVGVNLNYDDDGDDIVHSRVDGRVKVTGTEAGQHVARHRRRRLRLRMGAVHALPAGA